MKKAILIVMMFLAGCASTKGDVEMAMQVQASMKPTISFKCPAGGCSMEYTDPRDRQAFRMPTNGWDFANNLVNTTGSVVQGVAMPLVFGNVAVQGFKALKGSGTVTTTTNTDNHAVDSTHTPTVVTAPAPTVVTQPAPIVVQIPAGQVVNPVVVNPVIVEP